jgi:hypothetical protein
MGNRKDDEMTEYNKAKRNAFLVTTGLMFGLISGLLFDILCEVREVSTTEELIFRVVVIVLYAVYYITGRSE